MKGGKGTRHTKPEDAERELVRALVGNGPRCPAWLRDMAERRKARRGGKQDGIPVSH